MTRAKKERGWFERAVSDFVQGTGSDPSTFNTFRFLPGLSDSKAKIAAFTFQNPPIKIAACLGLACDKSLRENHQSLRTKMRKEIDSGGGGFDVYEQTVKNAQARIKYLEFITGHEEPINNTMELLCNGNEVTTSDFLPLQMINNLHKQARENWESVKGIHGYTSVEYINLKAKSGNTKNAVLETRVKKADWMQSFQQQTTTRISLPELLREDVPDIAKEVLWAYASSVMHDEQMVNANLNGLLNKSTFWPQLQGLDEYERCLEREHRLRYLEAHEEMEGVRRVDDRTGQTRLNRNMARYKSERAKTLLLYATRWMNPDHEVAKIMLKQFKNVVDADEEKSRKRKEKQKQKDRERYVKSESEKRFAGGVFTLNELEEAANKLLKQKTLKSW